MFIQVYYDSANPESCDTTEFWYDLPTTIQCDDTTQVSNSRPDDTQVQPTSQKCFDIQENLYKQSEFTETKECDQFQNIKQQASVSRARQKDFNSKPYKCYQCEKSFAQACHLRDHMNIHLDIRPYKCEICYKSFNWVASFRAHMNVHSNFAPYKCDQCQKSFSGPSALSLHMNSHLNRRPFKCDQCDKSFTRLTTLRRHIKTHSNIRPHICDKCQKSFTRATHLRDHMKIHKFFGLHNFNQHQKGSLLLQ